MKMKAVHRLSGLLQTIWDLDFSRGIPIKIPFLLITIFFLGLSLVYPIADVLLGIQFHLRDMNIVERWNDIMAVSFQDGFQAALPKIWLWLAFFTVAFRMTVIIRRFFLSKTAIGEQQFLTYIATYFPSYLGGMATTFLLLLGVNSLMSLMGIPL